MAEMQRLEEIFARAMLLRDPAGRATYLDEACGGDAELRRQVDSLLEAAEQAGDFLENTVRSDGGGDVLERPGTVIDRYKLLQEIGRGGFGVVYMAEQVEPVRRTVALKIIKAGMDTREVIARFEAERQALALMDHPNIARVLDAGATEAGRPYFVMELVRGVPITEFCDKENFSSRQRLDLFVKVCHAVQHAHQKGVIHRDIKPGNVLVTMHDGEAVPKVIDFGVAKAIGSKLTEKTLFTRFQEMIGTPAYMSPEQAEFSGLDIDTRSDIYSLGVLLYELLTGAPPFDAETFRRAALDEIRRMIREDEPPKPSTRIQSLGAGLGEIARRRDVEPAALARLVRGDLDWIVMKALEKDRRRRYDTPDALAADVARHLRNEPVTAAAPGTAYLVRKFVRRHRVGITTAVSLVLLLVAGAGVSTWQAVRATRAEHAQTALRVQAEARETISRAILLAKTGDPEGAEATLRSIPPLLARLEPADAAIIDAAVGDWRARQGAWAEAIAAYRRVTAAQPENFAAREALAPLLVATGDAAGYEELRRDMTARFGNTTDPLRAASLVRNCLILPWAGPEVATLARLADLAVREGPAHKSWRSFQFAKGLVEYRQQHYAEANRWLRPTIENGAWNRDLNRDVQAYMVVAMAHYHAGEASIARSTLTDGLGLARDGLPQDATALNDWPAWNDWLIARALMDEASHLIEGPAPTTAAPPIAAAPHRLGSPSSPLTVLPVLLGGRPFEKLTQVVGVFLEQAGLQSVELGDSPYNPGGNTGMDALRSTLSSFLAQHPVTTDLAFYAEYNGMPGQGINELRMVLLDRTGAVLWSERLSPQDEVFRRLEAPEPMLVTGLLVERVGPLLGLDEATRKAAKPGRIERMMEQESGIPPEKERGALPGRLQAMKAARGSLSLLILRPRVNDAMDSTSAPAIAQLVNEAGLGRAQVAAGLSTVTAPPLEPDEMKTLWLTARACQGWVRANHPDADYILFADLVFTPGRWEQGLVHTIVCDRRGDWVIVDLQNAELEDYQAIKPMSAEACARLVARRLESCLK